MWIIITVFILFVLIKLILPFIDYNARSNTQAFGMLNEQTKSLIQNGDVLELAALITGAEIEGDNRAAGILLDACLHRGYSFAKRIDRVRNELRIKAGMGSLKGL